MAEKKETVSTKIKQKDAKKLETVVSARGMSKASYARNALIERLKSDYEALDHDDIAVAEIRKAREEIEQVDEGGLFPDPFGLFK